MKVQIRISHAVFVVGWGNWVVFVLSSILLSFEIRRSYVQKRYAKPVVWEIRYAGAYSCSFMSKKWVGRSLSLDKQFVSHPNRNNPFKILDCTVLNVLRARLISKHPGAKRLFACIVFFLLSFCFLVELVYWSYESTLHVPPSHRCYSSYSVGRN